MKKSGWLITMLSFLFIASGSFMVLRSYWLGHRAAVDALSVRGGMETGEFTTMLQNVAQSYRWCGMALLIGGLFMLLLVIHSYLREVKAAAEG